MIIKCGLHPLRVHGILDLEHAELTAECGEVINKPAIARGANEKCMKAEVTLEKERDRALIELITHIVEQIEL